MQKVVAVLPFLILTTLVRCEAATQVKPLRAYPKTYQFPAPTRWCLYKGKTVKPSVSSWAHRAGWTLQWQFRYDYPIVVTTCFRGSFSQALQALTQAYEQAEHSFYLDLYPQQRVAIIGE